MEQIRTTMTDDNNRPEDNPSSFRRRDYLRLAGAAGVAGIGLPTLSKRASASGQEPGRALTIEGTGPHVNYKFSVSGSLNQSLAMNASRNSGDTISGNKATGAVSNGRDSWEITGELQSFSTDGPVNLYLNGEPLKDTITIEDINEGRETNYTLRVDGEVLKSKAMAATIDDDDEILPRDNPGEIERNNDTSATPLAGESYVYGGVYGGKDSYVISGDATGFHADGNVKVYLNGDRVHPGDFVRTTLTFESTNGNHADYSFSVSEGLTKSKYMDASISDSDNVNNGSATGAVGGGRDSYAFTGEITDFSGDDNLRVYLNGKKIDKEALSRDPQFKNTLTIDGGDGRTDYNFATEGPLKENYGLGDEDSIGGQTATGAVTHGQDSYTFSGDISSFSAHTTGSYKTILNGNEVDPETLGVTQTTPDAEDLPNEVTITDLGGGNSEYGIGVSGTLATGNQANTWSGDNASYDYGRGRVHGGQDSYKFSGEVRTFTDFENLQIDIFRDDQKIVISNTGDYEKTGYEMKVSGSFSSIDSDHIDGNTASGQVDKGTDVYGFTGEVLELTIEEKVKARIDFHERPLIERELKTLKKDVESSDQYASVKKAINSLSYEFAAEGVVGISELDESSGQIHKQMGMPNAYTGDDESNTRASATFALQTQDGVIIEAISQKNNDPIMSHYSDKDTIAQRDNGVFMTQLLNSGGD